MKYYVEKGQHGWQILDDEGYIVSYVSYDTKKEALAAVKVRQQEDAINFPAADK